MMRLCPTIRFDIFMAGDIATVKQVCREFCYARGFCVHIEAADYVYTGGEEAGVRVGILNYPRFPTNETALQDAARDLGIQLRDRLCQHSFLLVGPDITEWHTRRPQHLSEAAE